MVDDMVIDDFNEYEQYNIVHFTVGQTWYSLNTTYNRIIVDFDENNDYKVYVECESTLRMVEKFVVFTSANQNTMKLVYNDYTLMDGEYFAEKHHLERRFLNC